METGSFSTRGRCSYEGLEVRDSARDVSVDGFWWLRLRLCSLILVSFLIWKISGHSRTVAFDGKCIITFLDFKC